MSETTITVAASTNAYTTLTEAHVTGCRALTRKINGMPSAVSWKGMDLGQFNEMLANVDEGGFKIHTCLRKHVPADLMWKDNTTGAGGPRAARG